MHASGQYSMAPDDPWAERKYTQGLAPGLVDGYRTRDIVSAPAKSKLTDYFDGKIGAFVPVEQGKQEVMDIVKLMLEIAIAEGRLVDAPTPARLKKEGLKFEKLSFKNGDDFIFALPCIVTGKQRNRQVELTLAQWAAKHKAGTCYSDHFPVDYSNMRVHHIWFWEEMGIWNATLRMLRVGRITANAIVHIIANNGMIDDSVYENVKEHAGWLDKLTARPYLKLVKALMWDDATKTLQRDLLKDTWSFRLKMPTGDGRHVKWDAARLKHRPEAQWYLSTEPYDGRSRLNCGRGANGVLLADTLAQEVEKSLLGAKTRDWERAAEAHLAREVQRLNDSVEGILLSKGGDKRQVRALLAGSMPCLAGPRGQWSVALKKTKAKLEQPLKDKLMKRLRAKNTSIRLRGEQRVGRMRRAWKRKVTLAQMGYGTTGRTAYN